MAAFLEISQSQYCRKEANLDGFTEEEWCKMAELLGTVVDNIRNEDAKVVFQYNNGTNFGYIVNVSEQLVSELKEHNNSLKEIIAMQKQEITLLKKKLGYSDQ